MKRRIFIATGVALLATVKAFASKTKQSMGIDNRSNVFEILNDNKEIVYLKRGSIVKLPETPTSVETIIHFSVTKYRFGKSPVILSNKRKINGHVKEQIVVTKDVHLNKTCDFFLQYTGADVGWVILS